MSEASGEKCGYCRLKNHRQDSCPAEDRECNKCGLKGHWSVKCRMKKGAKKVAAVAEAEPSDGTLNTLGSVAVPKEADNFFRDVLRLSAVAGHGGEGDLSPHVAQ